MNARFDRFLAWFLGICFYGDVETLFKYSLGKDQYISNLSASNWPTSTSAIFAVSAIPFIVLYLLRSPKSN